MALQQSKINNVSKFVDKINKYDALGETSYSKNFFKLEGNGQNDDEFFDEKQIHLTQ